MLRVRQIGLMPYTLALAEQALAVEALRLGGVDGVLLATRHPPVITLGRRATPEELHVARWARRAMGVALFHVDRGGGATYHYPEQAVVYPVLHLARLHLNVKSLLAAVARALVDVLAGYGVEATWDPGRPGLYVGGAKIASVGFHVAGDVTTHGIALNVGPGIDGFALIDPCKAAGLPVTSLAHLLGRVIDTDQVSLGVAHRVAAEVSPGLAMRAVPR